MNHAQLSEPSLSHAPQLVQVVKAMAEADDVQEGDGAVLQLVRRL